MKTLKSLKSNEKGRHCFSAFFLLLICRLQKNRPALVLVSENEDVTLAFITTRIHWMKDWDLHLEPTEQNGLKKRSIVRLSKITTLEKQLVLGRLGSISKSKQEQLHENLKLLFDIE